MRVRVNMETDPISLTVIAADGKEHATFEEKDGQIIEVVLDE